MADGNTSQPATELKRVLSDVADNTVRELSHIVAIAKLALAYMERPDAYCCCRRPKTEPLLRAVPI